MSDETTKPTIETVLEHIAGLSTQLTAFRESTELRFHKLERKIGALNDDILEVRADIRMLEKLIESEPKAK